MSEDAPVNYASPLVTDFENFLPWACNIYLVEEVIFITKVTQNDYTSHTSGQTTKKRKSSKIEMGSGLEKITESRMIPTTSFGDLERVVKILAVYESNGSLVQLKFENNRRLPRTMMKIIGLMIKYQPHLESIVIKGGIDKYTIHEIKNFLPMSQVTDLCLDNAYVPEANYHILLEQFTTLRNLSLARCKIDDVIVEIIATYLTFPQPASSSIVLLNLSSNRITDIGASYLAKLLRTNRKLCYLNLSGNMLTDKGAELLLYPLLEFALTTEEIVSVRALYFKYIEEKNSLVESMRLEIKASEIEKKTAKKKTPLKSPTPSRKTDRDSQISMGGHLLDKAGSLIEELVGEFIHPFSKKDTFGRNGMVFCYGNNILCYLNLAYNELSYITLKRLVNVFENQKLQDRKPRGLLRINIEGNDMPSWCQELEQIKDICESMLTLPNKKASVIGKRKSVVKTPRPV